MFLMIISFFTDTPDLLRNKINAVCNKAVQMHDYVERRMKGNNGTASAESSAVLKHYFVTPIRQKCLVLLTPTLPRTLIIRQKCLTPTLPRTLTEVPGAIVLHSSSCSQDSTDSSESSPMSNVSLLSNCFSLHYYCTFVYRMRGLLS